MNRKCEKILYWFYGQKKRSYVSMAEIEKHLKCAPEKSESFAAIVKQKYIKPANRIDMSKMVQDSSYVPELKGYCITEKGKTFIENAEAKKQSWGGLIASMFKR